MKFSLIVPTVGRTKELGELLDSISRQSLQDFEVILADQNDDDRIPELIKKGNWQMPVVRVYSTRGISRARNAGLKIARGEFIGFPDDDCLYAPDQLTKISLFFEKHPEYGFVTGSTHDTDGSSVARLSKEASPIEKLRIYTQGIEFTIFIRARDLAGTFFDEDMGIGSGTPWQADEGPDLLLRLMEKGVKGFYEPSFSVWHPSKSEWTEAIVDRSYRYSCGSGHFLRKHRYPVWFFAYMLSRSIGGILVGLLKGNPVMVRSHAARLRGRFRGWFSYSAWQAKR